MKVYYTGDSHFDFDKTNASFQNFINQVSKINAKDLLVIFGDIHNNRKKRIQILRTIDNRIKCRCVFIIGNHDFWNLIEPITKFTVMNQKIRFIDEIKELKKKNFKKIIVLDNEIRKINGIRIMGSSGYWISSEFEKSAYLPREIHFLKTINKLLNSEKQKLVEQLSKKYIQYFSKKYKEWIDLYATHLKNADIVVTHQPTWTWISGEEKLEKNIKYINGHDHYYLGNSFSKRVKGHAFDKTAENNYNDGQNTYFGNYRTPIKFFII